MLREMESSPMTVLGTYTASGVVAINTILIDNIGTSKQRSIFVSGQAGTTGVITPEWYNSVTATWFAGRLTPVSGATTSTIGTTATLYQLTVMGDLLRFRLSTATTAGNTQLYVLGSQENICMIPNSITVTASNLSTNVAQMNGVAVSMGTGVTGTGVQRVTQATDVPITLAPNSTAGVACSVSNQSALTVANVKASAGCAYGVSIYNPNATVIYLQFYNTSGVPTLGTSVVWFIAVPPTSAVNIPPGAMALANFATGIGIGASTTPTSTGTPASAPAVTIFFK